MVIAIILALAQVAPTALSTPPRWAMRKGDDTNESSRFAAASVQAVDGGGRLTVRCDVVDRPIVSVQFMPKAHPPAAEPRAVMVKLDAAPAMSSNWEFPGRGAFTADPAQVYALASGIAAAKHIQVLTTDDAGAPISASFDGPGSDDLFRQVYETCGIAYASPEAVAAKR